MAANHSPATEGTAFDQESGERSSRAERATEAIAARAGAGTLAFLAGGALLARALRARTRWRTVLLGLAGLALVGIGLRQRLSGGSEPARPPEAGTADEQRDRPSIDEPTPGDPRRNEGDVAGDVSEAASADEPGEAVGPDPEQAEPTSTAEPEPEATPAEDASPADADEAADESDADEGAEG